jgi:hypothetical protein
MSIGRREVKRLRDLLLMRDCARGWPNRLLHRLWEEHDEKISQKGAGKKITSLEENGYILE